MALTDKLTAIADAIRGKTGGTEGMTLDAMVSAIEAIEAGGGSIPGVTVIKGTYTHLNATSVLYIEHNIGEIRPFMFYMKAKTTKVQAVGDSVYSVVCGVPTLDADTVSYLKDGVETTANIPIPAYCKVQSFSSWSPGDVGTPTVLDNSTTSASSYQIKMWPNGFSVGLYLGLLKEYEYEYTLIYGDLFGGMA